MKDSLLKSILLRIYRKANREKHNFEEKYTKIYIKYCRIKPQKLVFSNFSGKGYGDNPKYIIEEILRQGLEWDLIWLTNDFESEFPKSVQVVKYGSLKAMRELASAKVWINNVRNSEYPPKKQNQIYLQVWHGGMGIKKVEGAAEANLSKEYIISAKQDGFNTNGIISSCDVQTEEFLKYFWLNDKAEILKIGQPRNDVLFNKCRQEIACEIKEKIGISDNKKVILYVPTFRDDFATECYNIDSQMIIKAFEERFNYPFLILTRLHPNVQWQEACFKYENTVINVTNYPDIQDLYYIADYMISDYSSAMFDFSLLHKPVFLFASDYEKYKESRGISLRLEDTPFSLSRTNKELVDNIRLFSEKDYWERFDYFKGNYWKPYDNGKAAYEVVKWIKNKIK